MAKAKNSPVAKMKMMSITLFPLAAVIVFAAGCGSLVFLQPQPARNGIHRHQNLTSMDKLIRFSIFLRSGVNPGTTAPGEPQMFSTMGAVGQDVGVIPPGPVK
jgi:hypothetical protein